MSSLITNASSVENYSLVTAINLFRVGKIFVIEGKLTTKNEKTAWQILTNYFGDADAETVCIFYYEERNAERIYIRNFTV